MRWSTIDSDRLVWKLAAGNTKADRAHIVPLSLPAMALLSELPKLDDYVLTTRKGTYITGYSKAKEQADRFMVAALGEAYEDWRFHDLRRTVATRMSELRIFEEIIGRVLNHAKAGVTARHYNQHGYLDEKRHALETWGAELMRIVGGAPPQ